MKKLLLGVALIAMMAAACEAEEATIERGEVMPLPGVERSVDPIATAPSAPQRDAASSSEVEFSAPSAVVPVPTTSTPAATTVPPSMTAAPSPPAPSTTRPAAVPAPITSGELVWAATRDGAAVGALDGATVATAFEARVDAADGLGIDRVEWIIDGLVFRDDDLQAPFNIRYTGTLPLGTTFGSDQGLPGSWRFVTGQQHVIEARVVSGNAVEVLSANFQVTTESPTTTPPPVTTVTTTIASSTTTTVPPAATMPAGPDARPIVYADGDTVLDQPNTIYDFQFGSPGEVVIRASNVEARNIRGPGARRIGVTGGTSITDSGFRNFEFTYAHVQLSDGATVTRPYFIDGWDVNPQPHIGEGDIIQFFAYQGDIIEPLVENVTIYGKRLPPNSDAHNDALQFEGIQGGVVISPTVRNNHIEGASNAAIQIGHTGGTLRIEGNTMSQRWESYYAVNAGDNGPSPVILWRNNTMLNGAQHIFRSGYSLHPDSEPVSIG